MVQRATICCSSIKTEYLIQLDGAEEILKRRYRFLLFTTLFLAYGFVLGVFLLVSFYYHFVGIIGIVFLIIANVMGFVGALRFMAPVVLWHFWVLLLASIFIFLQILVSFAVIGLLLISYDESLSWLAAVSVELSIVFLLILALNFVFLSFHRYRLWGWKFSRLLSAYFFLLESNENGLEREGEQHSEPGGPPSLLQSSLAEPPVIINWYRYVFGPSHHEVQIAMELPDSEQAEGWTHCDAWTWEEGIDLESGVIELTDLPAPSEGES
jgi:hypothetical protein